MLILKAILSLFNNNYPHLYTLIGDFIGFDIHFSAIKFYKKNTISFHNITVFLGYHIKENFRDYNCKLISYHINRERKFYDHYYKYIIYKFNSKKEFNNYLNNFKINTIKTKIGNYYLLENREFNVDRNLINKKFNI
mgnify:CR=1 FL=1